MNVNHDELLGITDMDRARDIQTALNAAYAQIERGGSTPELDRKIAALEKELDTLLSNQAQAVTPGGYYTSDYGAVRPSGTVNADAALVVGSEYIKNGRSPLPWILLALAAAGAATYFTLKG